MHMRSPEIQAQVERKTMPRGIDFRNLKEGFDGFKRNAISDLTPPKIARAIEGGYYAGAQIALTLLCEAMKIDLNTAPKAVLDIVNECQTFFALAKAQASCKEGK
jgi:hypothetical protein